jgi:hypothetical protein
MKLVTSLFAALLVVLAPQTASAQSSYPNRPVKILVGLHTRDGAQQRHSFA